MSFILYSLSSTDLSRSAKKTPLGWIPTKTVLLKVSWFSINWQAKRWSAMSTSVAFNNTFWLIEDSECDSEYKSKINLWVIDNGSTIALVVREIPRYTRNDKGMLGMTRGMSCRTQWSIFLRDSSLHSEWQGNARNDKGNVMQNEAQRSEASHWSALRTEAGYRVPPKAWPRFRRGNAQKGPIKKASRNSRGFAFIENEAITFYRPFCLSVLEA